MNEFDYRYYSQQGLPFLGTAPLFKAGEYESQTQLCRIARQAFFDLRKPEERKNGHTLEEILSLNACGEYEIVAWKEYEIASEVTAALPAVFVHLVWYEKFDVLVSQYPSFIKNKFKNEDRTTQLNKEKDSQHGVVRKRSKSNTKPKVFGNAGGEAEVSAESIISDGGSGSGNSRTVASPELEQETDFSQEATHIRSSSRVIWSRKRQKTKVEPA
jgi:hypothetical protein